MSTKKVLVTAITTNRSQLHGSIRPVVAPAQPTDVTRPRRSSRTAAVRGGGGGSRAGLP